VQTSQHANSGLPGLPKWFDPNDWEQLTYYALSEACRAPPDGTGCTGSPQLTLGHDSGVGALVAAAGDGLKATVCNGFPRNQMRPAAEFNVCDLLEGEENTDADDTYVQIQRSDVYNDFPRAVWP
jgi:hypothetical protein